MAPISQSQWTSAGWNGGPGYTSFYSSTITAPELQDFLDAQKAFFEAIKTYIPNDVTYTPPANYRIVDAATGDLDDIVPVDSAQTPTTGTGGGAYAAPSGISVNWLTTTPATSRLVVGRTYLVPTGVEAYQDDGTLNTTALGVFQAAASALVTAVSPIMVIWRRPVGGAGGSVATVVAAKVNDRVSILRSRRS